MLHCNGIDPFVTLMGNFNWGPISRNDIVSKTWRESVTVNVKTDLGTKRNRYESPRSIL